MDLGRAANVRFGLDGGVTIMFYLQSELAAKVKRHQHWIKVDDAEALCLLRCDKGATALQEIEDKPCGFREYAVEDLSGYRLRFAGPPASEVAKSRPFPVGVKIDWRKPTPEKYAEVAGAAFGYKEFTPRVLETTWNGLVALSPSGEPIGVSRNMQEAPGWFSIWDVGFLQEWHSRRIGSKLMDEALAKTREATPSAIVYLFTFKPGFYERLGFGKETASMRRL